MNIEIISGSPREQSLTNRLALHLHSYLQQNTDHTVGIIDVREWQLPLLQEVFTTIDKTPDQYKPLAKRMFAADAFIFVTPEYNGSYSPAIGNLMDHFPKQSRKAFGIATASTGAMGGMRSTQQLLLLVPGLFGVASPHMLVIPFVDKKFGAEGNLLDENFKKAIDNFVNEFLWLAGSIQQANKPVYN